MQNISDFIPLKNRTAGHDVEGRGGCLICWNVPALFGGTEENTKIIIQVL
jgi:hypothetical protein